MDHIKKTKIEYFLILILLCIVIFGVILTFQKQSIKIIYFRNSGCRIIENTDKILEKIRSDFKEKIVIEYVQVQMYPDDPPDTTRIKQLREKYSIYGVPDIIINGKKFTEEFTEENLKREICDEFIIKPEVCG